MQIFGKAFRMAVDNILAENEFDISLKMAKPTRLKPRQCSSYMTLHHKKRESIS
jgi:hypothetical protein